jgi:SAM-dependent methyltransferase
MYDIEPHIAEIYDQSETYHDDVDLLLSLILSGNWGARGDVGVGSEPAPTTQNAPISGISILEPFCGTGRILIPLAQAGYNLVGLDQAAGMLARTRQKLACLPPEVQSRTSLCLSDVIMDEWPSGFDLVVLGGNCLYELATSEEQEHVIHSAATCLKPGGYVYVDNDHMEGGLDPSWQQSGTKPGFPSGTCADGTKVKSTTETIWFDIPARLAKYGFGIDRLFGDRAGNPYTPASSRAIFWARKYPGDQI